MKKTFISLLLIALGLACQSCEHVAPAQVPPTINTDKGKAQAKQVTLSVTADGPVTTFKYRWFRNNVEIADATTATLTVSADKEPEGKYFARVWNDKGTVDSDIVTVKLVDGEITVSANMTPVRKAP